MVWGGLVASVQAEETVVLVAPLGSRLVYLVDGASGEVRHRWDLPTAGTNAYLDRAGLMTRHREGPTAGEFDLRGKAGVVETFDADGTLVEAVSLSTATTLQHHDFERLPNGNLLATVAEKVPKSRWVALGLDPATLPGDVRYDETIVEVKPGGIGEAEVVWRWRLRDHLVQDFDSDLPDYGDPAGRPGRVDVNFGEQGRGRPMGGGGPPMKRGGPPPGDRRGPPPGPFGGPPPGRRGPGRPPRERREPGADWIHLNAIDYHPDRDEIIVSSRHLNEVWVIDHSVTTQQAAGPAGDLKYRFGHPAVWGGEGPQTLFVAHDVRWVPPGVPGAGNVTLFHNRIGHPDGAASTIDEFALPVDGDGYRFANGRPVAPELVSSMGVGPRMFSTRISGAEKLPDGNVVICSGDQPLIVEMKPGGEVVWELDRKFGGGPEDDPAYQGGATFRSPPYRPSMFSAEVRGKLGL